MFRRLQALSWHRDEAEIRTPVEKLVGAYTWMPATLWREFDRQLLRFEDEAYGTPEKNGASGRNRRHPVGNTMPMTLAGSRSAGRATALLGLAALPLSGCIIAMNGGSLASADNPAAPASRLQGRWKAEIPVYDAEGRIVRRYTCTRGLRGTDTAVLTGFESDPGDKIATGTWKSVGIDRGEPEPAYPPTRQATLTAIDDGTMKWESAATANGENPAIPLKVRETLLFTKVVEPAKRTKP